MNTDLNKELKNLTEKFSELSDEEQVKEIEDKIKVILGVINEINNDNLTLVSTFGIEDKGTNLTNVFCLICSLEEEIAKLLLKQKSSD